MASAVALLIASLSGLSAPANAAEDDARGQDVTLIGRLFNEHCAVCHGEQLRGTAQGVALVGRELGGGATSAALETSIGSGRPERGMPAWAQTLTTTQIRALAIYIGEKRAGFTEGEDRFRVADPIVVPAGVIHSERQDFYVTRVVEGLDPWPSSMQVLPDGTLLVTEKHRGLLHIASDGHRTRIAGTPRIAGLDEKLPLILGVDMSNGWMLGVALHPGFRKNGWIYLSYGDLCEDCPRTDVAGPLTPSMTKVVRGRIRDGRWVDEQPIWSVGHEHYTQLTDVLAGGRMIFDDAGYLYIVVGMKNESAGVQDLARPWGKIHRIHDDGRVPADNPFAKTPGAMTSIWSSGHRNPQGMFYDRRTQLLWSSEHGPRGGDEINLIRGGRNYGWPLASRGVHYDGTIVDGWKKYGVPYDLSAIEQPVVEFTPSPALSALVVCRGRRFPGWEGDFIVGSLKARELYRVTLAQGRPVHRETLLQGIGRIRDIERSPDGDIWLLIEHPEGGKILRVSPARRGGRA